MVNTTLLPDVRHDVARVFIKEIKDPVFCHRYPTGPCTGGKPRGAKRPGHCGLRLISGQLTREGTLRLPASWRSGARVEGYGQHM